METPEMSPGMSRQPSRPERQPCPYRIVDDSGEAFVMGAVGGSAFHFLKGVYNSPRGERFLGGSQAVRMNAARVAGSFAVWGGLFSASNCSLVYLRRKEDPWNSIISGATTAGILQMRQGMRAAARSAVAGAALLALIEGVGIGMNRLASAQENAQQNAPVFLEGLPSGIPQEEAASSSSSSWFRGLFGGRKEEEKKSGSGVKVLESFDSPIPPTYEFK